MWTRRGPVKPGHELQADNTMGRFRSGLLGMASHLPKRATKRGCLGGAGGDGRECPHLHEGALGTEAGSVAADRAHAFYGEPQQDDAVSLSRSHRFTVQFLELVATQAWVIGL